MAENMSEREDRILANIVKETHGKLRNLVLNDEMDEEQIWRKHVKNVQESGEGKKYAEAMKNLSDKHWNNESRLDWIASKIQLYFFQKDFQRFFSRLQRKQESEMKEIQFDQQQVKILDVGSCHNPLRKVIQDKNVEIFALDLNPANEEVVQGDFLQMPLDENSFLRPKFFDSVVFCLLLEYLPTPKLRLKSIEKASKLLKDFGLLIIITPDSSHQGKNMNQMKSWRLALAQLGFIRIYYDKLKHVTCLAYVKIPPESYENAFEKEINQIQKKFDSSTFSLDSAFYIPQDL